MLESQPPPPSAHLPSPCLTHIFTLLPAQDLGRACCVNRHWYQVSQYDDLWQPLCRDVFMLDTATSPEGAPCTSFHEAFNSWKSHPTACKYEEYLPRASAAFAGIKAWLQEHAPAIHDSLQPGTTEDAIRQAEEALGGTPFPPALRVLYRICNGQELAFDKAFDTRAQNARRVDATCFQGLFGGYTFYQHTVSVRMYPLQRMVRTTRMARAQDVLTPGAIMFAGSYNLRKLFQVLPDGGIHVNTSSLDFIRAAPATAVGGGDGVLRWVEEYAERLQQGRYEAAPLAQEDMTFGINLFPVAGPDVKVAITRGVKVKASCILAPEHSNSGPIGLQTHMFSYCIRFSLLDAEEQRAGMNGPMQSCQLKSRHWIICDGPERDEVKGEAVVGQYPMLIAGGPEFAYQSCTQQAHPEGWMEGSFAFVEGSIQVPKGPRFDVMCPHFDLKVPDFIF